MAIINKLSAIGDAIREKTGKSELLTLEQMPIEIASITTGGGGGGDIAAEDLTFSGNLNSLFSYGNWNNILNKYGKQMTFQNVNNASNLFISNSSIVDTSALNIPFNNANINAIFSGAGNIIKLPKVSGSIDANFNNSFSGCMKLSSDEINDFFGNLTITLASNTTPSLAGMFNSCYCARDLYETLECLHTGANLYKGSSTSYPTYTSLFNSNYCLDTIENMPVLCSGSGAKTSNTFTSVFYSCSRLKDLIFKDNNGAPYVVKWKSQTLDLTSNVGYASISNNILVHNSGITADKEVKDDATYQALKDNPDWFTCDINYSRYNHDSAVNTINSLPDTSAYLATAGGTNTIKFKGAAGALTDGGAINTLTEEEIAVAAAKGWTVTLA